MKRGKQVLGRPACPNTGVRKPCKVAAGESIALCIFHTIRCRLAIKRVVHSTDGNSPNCHRHATSLPILAALPAEKPLPRRPFGLAGLLPRPSASDLCIRRVDLLPLTQRVRSGRQLTTIQASETQPTQAEGIAASARIGSFQDRGGGQPLLAIRQYRTANHLSQRFRGGLFEVHSQDFLAGLLHLVALHVEVDQMTPYSIRVGTANGSFAQRLQCFLVTSQFGQTETEANGGDVAHLRQMPHKRVNLSILHRRSVARRRRFELPFCLQVLPEAQSN